MKNITKVVKLYFPISWVMPKYINRIKLYATLSIFHQNTYLTWNLLYFIHVCNIISYRIWLLYTNGCYWYENYTIFVLFWYDVHYTIHLVLWVLFHLDFSESYVNVNFFFLHDNNNNKLITHKNKNKKIFSSYYTKLYNSPPPYDIHILVCS